MTSLIAGHEGRICLPVAAVLLRIKTETVLFSDSDYVYDAEAACQNLHKGEIDVYSSKAFDCNGGKTKSCFPVGILGVIGSEKLALIARSIYVNIPAFLPAIEHSALRVT